MSDQKLGLIRKKVEFYQQTGKPVHVVLLNTRKFYNGKIKKIKDDFFIIADRRAENVAVFFTEVFKIEPLEKNIK